MLKPFEPVQIILPVRDIVLKYAWAEESLFFYHGGAAGVVRDAIMMTPIVNAQDDPTSRLLHSVIHEFDRYEESCTDAGIYPKGIRNPETLETIVDGIEEDVYEFLYGFFGGQQVEIMRFVTFIDKDMLVYARRF